MPKYFFKRILPSYDAVTRQRMLRPLSRHFGGAAIWRINRQSVARALAIGTFCGALPVPIQMLLAAMAAIAMRANLPAAMASTFWSNPLTMPPIFYFNYRVGAWLLGSHTIDMHNMAWDVESLRELGGGVLLPLFSGSLLVGTVLAALAYAITIVIWRWQLARHYYRRAQRRRQHGHNG